MKIKDIGGEFGLIKRIKKNIRLFSDNVVIGIDDDAAVLKYGKNNYLLFSTDMLVENEHFSLEYLTPEQIGMKAVEQNVSDIAAMGGLPRYAVVSLGLPEDTEVDFVDRLFYGINKKSKRYKISIVGGNISHSQEIVVDITLVGFVEKKLLTLRKNAKIGDLIFCSGDVGKSAAGLELLKRGLIGASTRKHAEPQCRLDLARKLVKIGINSMIDVSDGVASEIKHICQQSNVGAVIHADKIPISKNTIIDSKKLKKNPLEFALYGGEDFELVFTANKNKLQQLTKYDVKVIGEVVEKKFGIELIRDNRKSELKNGYDHFKK